jgi:hypothetical protein
LTQSLATLVANPNLNEHKKQIADLLDAINESPHDSLFSDEGILTPSWNTLHHVHAFSQRLDNLKDIIPSAKIVILYRPQLELLVSEYKSAVEQRYFLDIEQFLVTLQEARKLKGHQPWIYPYGIDLKEYLDLLRSKFGEQNILALPLSILSKNQHKAIRDISRFISPDISDECVSKLCAILDNANFMMRNQSFTPGAMACAKFFNKVVSYLRIPIHYSARSDLPRQSLRNNFFRRWNWLWIRQRLQNQSSFESLVMSLVVKRSKDKSQMLRKFPDLVNHYAELNDNLFCEK